MTRTNTILLLALTGGALLLGGCLKKKIDVTFTNLTEKQMDVYLTGPGEGTGVVGTLNGKNDRVHTQIQISGDQLPAQYNWSAGPTYSGRFTIHSERRPQPRYIDIGEEK